MVFVKFSSFSARLHKKATYFLPSRQEAAPGSARSRSSLVWIRELVSNAVSKKQKKDDRLFQAVVFCLIVERRFLNCAPDMTSSLTRIASDW